MLLDDRPEAADAGEAPQSSASKSRLDRTCETCGEGFQVLPGNGRKRCVECVRAERHAREFAEHPELFPEGVRRRCTSCGRQRLLRHFRIRSYRSDGVTPRLASHCEVCETEWQQGRNMEQKAEGPPARSDEETFALLARMFDLNRRIHAMRGEGRMAAAQPLFAKVADLRLTLGIDTRRVHGPTRAQVLAGWTELDGSGASIEAETP